MLTKDEALQLLNLSPSSLDLLVRSRMILEINSESEPLYPRVQFTTTGIDARFAALISIFKQLNLTADQIWRWLNLPLAELRGESAVDYFLRTEEEQRLRFLISAHWSIEALIDPQIQNGEWPASRSERRRSNGVSA